MSNAVKIKTGRPKFHHVKVRFDADVFARFFIQQEQAFGVSIGMPQGSTLVDIVWDFDLGQGVAVFYHKDFEAHVLTKVPYVKMEWAAFGIVESQIKLVDGQGRKLKASDKKVLH